MIEDWLICVNTDVLGRTCKYSLKLSRRLSLCRPDDYQASQVTWLRGNDQDREAEAPETLLPEVAAETQQPEIPPKAIVLPWRRCGNVIASAGTFLVELLERA